MHNYGLSLGFLQQIYEETTFLYFKKVLVSEMVKGIFCDVLRSELNSTYATFPAREFDELTV